MRRSLHPLDDSPESVALARTRSRMALRSHLLIYCAVCAGLVAIWALTPSRHFWPGFAMAGWGVALLIQWIASRAFVRGSATWRRVHDEELARARDAAR